MFRRTAVAAALLVVTTAIPAQAIAPAPAVLAAQQGWPRTISGETADRYPEGVSWDPTRQAFLIGSMATGRISAVDRSGQPPYLVATVQKDRIVALQVSGSATTKDFGFNHINLGDDTKTLIRYFGAASRVGPSGEAGTDLWSYQPWPFSFEVKAAHVTSIRIVDPTYQE